MPIYAQSGLPAPTNLKPLNSIEASLSGEFPFIPFSWNKVETATAYELQVSKSEDNFAKLYYQIETADLIRLVSFRNSDKIIYKWRVRAISPTQTSEWSSSNSISVVLGTSNEPSETIFSKIRFSLYPNPSQSSALIEWNAIQNDTFKVDIWNLTGQQLQTFKDMYSFSGKNLFPINLSHFPSGYYIITITNSKEIFKLPLIINH